jgi:hypothetical protein
MSPSSRCIDLCLILQRAKTHETILRAGGRWDSLENRFTDQEPESLHVVSLEESQVEFVRWFSTCCATSARASRATPRLCSQAASGAAA